MVHCKAGCSAFKDPDKTFIVQSGAEMEARWKKADPDLRMLGGKHLEKFVLVCKEESFLMGYGPTDLSQFPSADAPEEWKRH
jgi:hypothetical protein